MLPPVTAAVTDVTGNWELPKAAFPEGQGWRVSASRHWSPGHTFWMIADRAGISPTRDLSEMLAAVLCCAVLCCEGALQSGLPLLTATAGSSRTAMPVSSVLAAASPLAAGRPGDGAPGRPGCNQPAG